MKAGVPPGKDLLRPLDAEELLLQKQGEDLEAEESGDQGIVKTGDFMKNFLFICSSLCDEKMDMRVKIDFLPEGLNNGNDPGGQISLW
jgi:hypothetical protein